MEGNLDPEMQRIIQNAAGFNNQDGHVNSYSYTSREPRNADWSYGTGPRQLMQQETSSYTDGGRSPFDRPAPSFQAINTGPNQGRLSFAPRSNIYGQQESEPRTLSNVDNHFTFSQNLRQDALISHSTPRPTATQPKDTIGDLANAMLMQQPMLQRNPEPVPNSSDFFRGFPQPRSNPFKPQQKTAPPFNLSGFTYSPAAKQASSSSSPSAGQHSSPTTRISIRREANRPAPPSHFPNIEAYSEDYIAESQTPHRYMANLSSHTPRTLTLGHAPPMAHGIQLISPHELPDRFRQVFPYPLFNAVQSKCFAPIYRTNDNVVVSAPTGSGKTAILELAVCRLVESYSSGQFKIVYQAPTKSLCSERLRDWQKKFSHLNLVCAELTGDTTLTEMSRVRSASIIVTTPEKWDSITRKWADHHKLVSLVKLMLIDEVHILKDVRGATLEAVVSRMKTNGADIRFVALSATVPNSHDIAVWLGRDHTNQHLPAHRETFNEDFRPVKLQKHIHGFDGMMNDFAFEKVLDGKMPILLAKYTQKKPIMIFCFTRKSCEGTAAKLAEWWTRQRVVDRAWDASSQRVVVNSKELSQLIACGVAFHHAGLDPQDRHAVETSYLKGDINVICCTSTLAVGVNLPCHMVVLKGTVGYQDGLPQEYSDLEVMQMLGRAGRPQFDDSAVAIIMTRSDKVDRYKKMVSGRDVLESTLHLNLIGHLNSEISLGSIKDLYSAKKWLSGTFLSVRMRENPNYYKIADVSPGGDTDQRIEQICERDIKLLQDYNLVSSNDRMTCTEYGDAMSRYMVQFETMKLLLSIPKHAKTEQILQVICQAVEFKDLRLKPQERPFLREFNKSPFIKFPVKENVTSTPHKISLMIQVQLGGVDLPTEKDFNQIRRQYLMEKSLIFERVQRLIRCVIDCKAADCDAVSTKQALDLARSLSAEYWEYSNLQLRQIPNIGPVAVRKLVSQNINTVAKLFDTETATIERYLSKNPPYGKKIKDTLANFPWLKLNAEIVGKAPFKHGKKPKVHIRAIVGFHNEKIPTWHSRRPSVIFTAETKCDGILVHLWRGNITNLEKREGYEIKFAVELSRPEEEIKCLISCEEIVGTVRTCELKHDIPASYFPILPPTVKIQKPRNYNEKSTKAGDSDDEYGGDDFQDDEILAVVKNIENVEKEESHYDSDDFIDIDNVDSKPATTSTKKMKAEPEFLEPFKMANGKWTCSHTCRDGGLLKNGQKCKHQCCREGLDKPPKPRKPSSTQDSTSTKKQNDSQDAGMQGKQTLKSSAKTKNRKKKSSHNDSNVLNDANLQSDEQIGFEGNIEIIDLVEQLSPVTYEKIAPREYRNLHSLHTSLQKGKDKIFRLPKKKPEFSYEAGAEPEPAFLKRGKDGLEDYEFEDIDDDNYEFPPVSSLIHKEEENVDDQRDPFGADPMEYEEYEPFEETPGSAFHESPLRTARAGMYALPNPVVRSHLSPAPKLGSSFGNGIFDFDAFSDTEAPTDQPLSLHRQPMTETIPSSNPRTSEQLKRELSPGPEIPKAKHRRVTQEESAAAALQQMSSTPAWVNEFESSFINELKDCVEFV